MPTDGVLLYALSREIDQKLIKGRIDKIYGLNRTDILIRIRSAQGNHKLFLSAHPVSGGMYITKQDYISPNTPSLFTMVLRKHLSGGKLLSVRTHEMDRIVFLDFVARNELGDLCKKTLILEIMGKHSNIILVDDKMVIIDAQKKFNHIVSRHREVLPNLPYVFPPNPDKLNFLDYDLDHLSDDLMQYSTTTEQEDFVHLLPRMFNGFSTSTVKTILQDCELDEASLQYAGRLEYQRLHGCLADFRELLLMQPKEGYLLYRKNLPFDVALMPGKTPDNKVFDSLSLAIDTMYGEKTDNGKREQEKQKLKKNMNQRLKKLQKKLTIHLDNIQKAKETDIYRIKGELLTASLHMIRPGQKTVVLENYYDPDYAKIEIELNPAISASANAAKYFKKVSKIREAAKVSREMLYDLHKDIEYLESILLSLDNVTSLDDIEEIADEIRRIGFIPPQKGKKQKKKKRIESKPMHFVSSSGLEILVGKNNKQNDRVTRSAADDDLWLHTKKIPGSHVILKTNKGAYDDQSLLEAATLAAYYSKGRQSSKVEVDYTLKKNVKKPGGAKPGMVIYETNQTFLAEPNEELVNNLNRGEIS
jgi:predicted ribosome quality control (RQC) complex YloA/Tae2 family protein